MFKKFVLRQLSDKDKYDVFTYELNKHNAGLDQELEEIIQTTSKNQLDYIKNKRFVTFFKQSIRITSGVLLGLLDQKEHSFTGYALGVVGLIGKEYLNLLQVEDLNEQIETINTTADDEFTPRPLDSRPISIFKGVDTITDVGAGYIIGRGLYLGIEFIKNYYGLK